MKKEKINYNSRINQDIKSKFVDREVYNCFSYEMDEILKKEIVSYDDIDNLYECICPECREAMEEIKEENEGAYRCTSCNCEVDSTQAQDLESQPQEIFEWWIVSRFLYDKLKDKGCPVLEWENNYYWGRCTTGQAILLDWVISEICSEMEILEGQKYDWSK